MHSYTLHDRDLYMSIIKHICTISFGTVITAMTLTGCLSTKPYQPPKNSETATLTYEIDPSTFYAPKRFTKHGYMERVDIQLIPSVAHIILLGGGEGKTLYMTSETRGTVRDINVMEANKPLRFSFEHKMVKGLGEWPLLCVTTVEATLEPNQTYVLKGKTINENFRTEKTLRTLFDEVETEDRSCQVQIINTNTNAVIADSGMIPFKR